MFFDTIIVCSVTGSTQAGHDRGLRRSTRSGPGGGAAGRTASMPPPSPPRRARRSLRIARFTAEAIGLGRELRDDEVILDDRYHAGIYGIPDAPTLAAMRLAARLEAMITDPVYEGKSMAGLIDLVIRGEIERSSNVLYAHLGGQPAINGYASLFS